jgi:MGT family glycosyltransferase
MSTIAFVNIDMHGHVNPTLPIVAELVRRGHNVTYHVGDAFTTEVAAAGAKAYRYDATPPERHARRLTPTRFLAGLARNALYRMPGLLEDLVAIGPDLIVHDVSCLWGHVAARRLGVPAATSFPTFAFNAANPSPTRPTPAFLRSALRDLPSTVRYIRSRIRLRTRWGLRGLPMVDLADVRQPVNLLFTSAEFQPGSELLDASFRFVGPCIGARPAAEATELAGAADPVVYVSLGTVFSTRPDLMRMLVETIAPLAGHVVVSTGLIEPEALAPLPAHVEAHRSVSQPDVLERADLFVTHGGANSANESLYYGVPMLVLPQHADQPQVAARVADLGAGLALPPGHVTAEHVHAAVTRLLSEPSFAAAAGRLREAQRRCGGALHAADELETRLRSVGATP